MRPGLRKVGVLLLLAVVGCTGGERRPISVTLADSAGIEIVTNHESAGSAVATWAVDPEPALRIEPSEDGGYTFFQISDVLPLEDGGIAVFNGSPPQVLVFDSTGALRAKLGGPGEGPGEFKSGGSLLTWGDSVGAWDPSQRRLSVFTMDGTLARGVTLRDLWQGNFASAVAPMSDSAFFLHTNTGLPLEPRVGSTRGQSESFVLTPSGEVRGRLGPFPGNEVFIGEVGMGLVLFGERTLVAAGPEQVAVGTGEEPEIGLYGMDGKLARLIRWSVSYDRTVTKEHIDHFLDAVLEGAPDPEREAARGMIDRIPIAKQMPPHGGLLWSSDGDLWVSDYPGPEAGLPPVRPPSLRWQVFDASGAMMAQVETPVGFIPYAVRGDLLVGVEKSELLVESIRVYKIDR